MLIWGPCPQQPFTCPIHCAVVIAVDAEDLPTANCHLNRGGELGLALILKSPQASVAPPHPLPERYLGDVGHQIVGDALWVLTNAAGGMGPNGVKVSQQHRIPGLWIPELSALGAL